MKRPSYLPGKRKRDCGPNAFLLAKQVLPHTDHSYTCVVDQRFATLTADTVMQLARRSFSGNARLPVPLVSVRL